MPLIRLPFSVLLSVSSQCCAANGSLGGFRRRERHCQWCLSERVSRLEPSTAFREKANDALELVGRRHMQGGIAGLIDGIDIHAQVETHRDRF